MSNNKNYIQTEIDECVVYIGRNKKGNDVIIRMNQYESNAWWFHFDNISSCHLIILLDNGKKPTKYQLCRIKNLMLEYTSRANDRSSIIYTQLKNIKTTNIAGSVVINPSTTQCF